jgi:hypothetical protein
VRKIIGGPDDQLQECGLIFAKCCARYQVRDPAHFMALYKTSIFRHWCSLSPKDWSERHVEELLTAEHIVEPKITLPDAELISAWAGFSSELRTVLSVIANAPAETLSAMLDEAKDDAALSRRLCRMAGARIAPVAAELRSALGAEETCA